MSRSEINKMEIDFLRQAYMVAKQQSTDPSIQNGAILVDYYRSNPGVVGWGANKFPNNVREAPERWERPLKYEYVEHAERNALYQACRAGVSTQGLWMFVPWFACVDCARAIIQCGISTVVGHQQAFDKTPQRWRDNIARALEMLDEAGVIYRLLDCHVGVAVRFNEKETMF